VVLLKDDIQQAITPEKAGVYPEHCRDTPAINIQMGADGW
jgi:hypothetical protein